MALLDALPRSAREPAMLLGAAALAGYALGAGLIPGMGELAGKVRPAPKEETAHAPGNPPAASSSAVATDDDGEG